MTAALIPQRTRNALRSLRGPTDRRSAASALTAKVHHEAMPPGGKSRSRAKRGTAAVPRDAIRARQLERLVVRHAQNFYRGERIVLLGIEFELVEYSLLEGGDQLFRTRLDLAECGVCLALALDFAEARPAVVLGDTSNAVLGLVEVEP